MSIVVACGSPPVKRAPATPALALVTSFPRVSLGTVPDGTDLVFARGQPGAFAAVSKAADGVIVVRTDRDDQVRVEGARSPALALSDTDVALAYVATDGSPRLALFDSALVQLRTIDLGVDVKAGRTFGQPVLVAWNPRQLEWTVAWLGLEKLSAKEIRQLRAEGEMIPIDRKVERVRVARIARDGALVATNRIGKDSDWGLTLLALEPQGHGYAVLTRTPTRPTYVGEWEHDEIRLTVVAPGKAAAASAAHRVPKCFLELWQRAALAAHAGGFVAAIPTCPSAEGEPDALLLLGFDPSGQPTTTPATLVSAKPNAFDVRWHDGHPWLARTLAADSGGRPDPHCNGDGIWRSARVAAADSGGEQAADSGGEQVVVDRLGPDLRPDSEFAVVVHASDHPVEFVELVDGGVNLAAVVRSGGSPVLIDLAPLSTGKRLPRTRSPPPRTLEPCPRR